MKKKLYLGALVLEAALCIFLALSHAGSSLLLLAALPFAPLADVLRQLSLSGDFQNVLAWILYTAICLSPLLMLIRKKRYQEDGMAAALCALLFAIMYFLINPALLGEAFTATEPVGKAVLGGTFWSLLIVYILLRLRRRLMQSNTPDLLNSLTFLLALMNFLLVGIIFHGCTATLLTELHTLQTGNTALSPLELAPTCLFMVLRHLAQALPYALDMVIIFVSLRLLARLKADRYSQEASDAASALARLSGQTLICTALVHAGVQILQLVFIRQLYSIDSTLQLPLASIVFMAAALLAARYIQESQKLKAENDSFI